MRVLLEPSLDQWAISTTTETDRAALAECVAVRAERLGTPELSRTAPVITAGHQASLWHPGILAKYIAMAKAAEKGGAAMLNIVVDHDVQETLSLQLPMNQSGRLATVKIKLAPGDRSVPMASSPPMNSLAVLDTLRATRSRLGKTLVVDVESIMAAFEDIPECRTAAEQVSVVLGRLMRPYTGSIPLLFGSDLLDLPAGKEIIEQMRDDAGHCVNCYNRAVVAYPESGIEPLDVASDHVELPLWGLAWQEPRRRVFVSCSGRDPRLSLGHGQMVDTTETTLAPRALLLTGLMRLAYCDLFVHGTGGARYDRVTEHWFKTWLGVELAPMTVASADLYMRFDAPLAQFSDVARAKWWGHHLPHNLDRALDLAGSMIDQKHRLLAHMDDDRDRLRRFEGFRQIHQINDALVRQHPAALAEAKRQLDLAEVGAANRIVADKRDWCFALYPPEQLHDLVQRIESAS